ncbi:MAG: bifunctional YncE family protein/alkaline phosphatase family protein [Bryobacteraceae bacterium]
MPGKTAPIALAAGLGGLLFLLPAAEPIYWSTPAGVRPAVRRPGAASIIPGGRIVSPLGAQVITGFNPSAIAVGRSGKVLVSLDAVPERPSLTVTETGKDGSRSTQHLVAPKGHSVGTGHAFNGDKQVWITEGGTGLVSLVDLGDGEFKRSIEVGGHTGALAFDAERQILYILDSKGNRLVVIDARQRRIAGALEIPATPAALALAPDNRKLYVAAAGDLHIVDVTTAASPRLEATINAGENLAGVLAAGSTVYASDSTADAVIVVDAEQRKVAAQIPLRIPRLENLRGLQPMGLAFHASSNWLLVANAGVNAVSIVDVKQRQHIGLLPAGWHPIRIEVDRDNIYVANLKGNGAGPRLPRQAMRNPEGLLTGSVSVFAVPAASELATHTGRALAASGLLARQGDPPSVPDAIRHVVLIVKSGRAFDEVLGNVVKASNSEVGAAPSLARFGRNGYVDGRSVRLSLHKLNVTPNHQSLAQQFAFSDNFYADAPLPSSATLKRHLERHGSSFREFDGAATADLDRASRIIAELKADNSMLPQDKAGLVLIRLPGDRMSEPRPSGGYPYDASFLAENDLALGRVVDALSRSAAWPQMAVFATEDSVDGGFDHIDASRTILIAAGPYAKRNYVSHVNTNHAGLVKTIFRLLRVPPLAISDATASDLSDLFTDTPNPEPYAAHPVDKRLFEPDRAR